MVQSFSILRRAALAAVAALSLAACNRAEYAVLPKSPAYMGSAPAHYAPRPAAAPVAEAPVAAAAPAAPAPLPQAAPAKLAPKAPRVAAAAPVAQPVAPAPAVAAVPAAPIVAAAPAAPTKLNLVQRLMLKKVSKNLNSLMADAPQIKQRSAAASTARLDSGLRSALILLLVGIIVAAFAGVAGIFGLIGAILIIIGLVLLLIYLLDQA